jgi:HTH-type transcriptional regulator / antitoxin HigA
MSTLAAVNPAYTHLLMQVSPQLVRSDEQNEAYIEMLYKMDQRSDRLTPEEVQLADLLTLLVEEYEAKHYELPKASPLEVIAFLMDQHCLKQKDLADVFGTPSIVSEVLRGKRERNKQQIKRLSERFGVSPELFF